MTYTVDSLFYAYTLFRNFTVFIKLREYLIANAEFLSMFIIVYMRPKNNRKIEKFARCDSHDFTQILNPRF